MLKPEIRIIAWDDCAFEFRSKCVQIIGAVYRGGSFPDGILSTAIEKDGTDATDKIAESITRSRHYDQLSYIMLDGISYAGFNLVDIKSLHEKTGLPVLVVQRKEPDLKRFRKAMRIFPDYKKRLQAMKNAGSMFRFKNDSKKMFYQKQGMSNAECDQLLKITCIRSNVPEPLRVAHLIASGLSERASGFSESRGRA